jgi:dihydropteroate synthase
MWSPSEPIFAGQLDWLAGKGVMPDQVALDVGIGFGKTLEHNLRLLATMGCFRTFTRPLVLGCHGNRSSASCWEWRLPDVSASLACAVWAVSQGAQIVRTHDVAATRQAVRMAEALRNRT